MTIMIKRNEQTLQGIEQSLVSTADDLSIRPRLLIASTCETEYMLHSII